MSRLDDLRKLIKERRRHLQILAEKEAKYGIDVPAYILLEKQDIEAEIEKLETELAVLVQVYQSGPSTPPPTPPPGPLPTGSRPEQLISRASAIKRYIWISAGVGLLLFLIGLIGFTFADQKGLELVTPTQAAFIPLHTPPLIHTLAPTSTPSSASVEPHFEEISFAHGYDDRKLAPIEPTTCFSEGITEVHAIFEYNGMSNGVSWERVLYRDGEEQLRKSLNWDKGQSGVYDYYIEAGGNPIPPGQWRLELYLNNQLMREGSFWIQSKC